MLHSQIVIAIMLSGWLLDIIIPYVPDILEFLQHYNVLVTGVSVLVAIVSVVSISRHTNKQLKLTRYPQVILNLLPYLVESNKETNIIPIRAVLVNEGESAALNVRLTYQIEKGERITRNLPHLSSLHREEEIYLPINLVNDVGNVNAPEISIYCTVTYENIFRVRTILRTIYSLKCEGKIPTTGNSLYRLEPGKITYEHIYR